MDLREQSLKEIANRIKRDKDVLGIKSFKWNTNNTTDKENTPSIYMLEGKDIIKKHSTRNKIGYPARRELEVEIEIVVKKDDSLLRNIYQMTRRAIFCEREDTIDSTIWTPNNLVAENSFIIELSTEGPGAYKIPELIGIIMTIGLSYTDKGIYQDFLTT